MAAPISFRLPPALRALLDAKAAAAGMNRTDFLVAMVTEALTGLAPGDPPPDAAAPDPEREAPSKPPAKAVRRVAPAVKPKAARQALAEAEARTGVGSFMDSLPVGNTRPPMQRARDRAEPKAKR
jgi:hypothetical protein